MTTTANYNEIIFILDRSGSMCGLESDTIGGYNSFLQQQKNGGANAVISTVLFDDIADVIHDRVPISKIQPLTNKDYQPQGCTALLDAVGGAVKHIHRLHKNQLAEDRPDKTIFVIITDGYENSSRKYTYKKVKSMIEKRQTKDNWEFVFLGANIDAAAEAANFGIKKERAVNYKSDSAGTRKNFEMMSCACLDLSENADFDAAFAIRRKLVDDDVKHRGK